MQKKTRKRLYAFGGLFLAAILPFLMYKIVRSLSDDKISLPGYYHPIGLDTTLGADGQKRADTLYHTVSNFRLTNQLGQDFDLYRDTKGMVVVAHVFSSTCQKNCPKLSLHAENLQYAFRKRDTILRILSITTRPDIDDIPMIRKYAQDHHANHDMWYFLTGEKENIQNVVSHQLFIDTLQPGVDSLSHSSYFVLLDFNKHIRGYYDGLDSMELKRLKDDIALLPMEKNPKP